MSKKELQSISLGEEVNIRLDDQIFRGVICRIKEEMVSVHVNGRSVTILPRDSPNLMPYDPSIPLCNAAWPESVCQVLCLLYPQVKNRT